MTKVTDSQEKHRLLFVSNLFPDKGESVRGLDNATLLHALRSEWSIRVISPRPVFPPWRSGAWEARDSDQCFQPSYVPCPYIPKIGDRWNSHWMARSLEPAFRAALETFQPHLVLVSWLFPDGCAIAELSEKFDVPFVMITQGTDTHHYLDIPLRRRKILAAIEKSSAVVCRSGDLANRLEEAGAPKEKLKAIYNGVDTDIFRRRDKTKAQEELGHELNQPLLLFVGNYLPVKDPLFLIQCLDRLNRERDMRKDQLVRLILIGDGPMREKMQSAITQIAHPELVVVHERMPPEKIARYMNATDALCLSSKNEGFPNVILEAMACGTRVVSTRVGGIGELLDDSTGMLVDPQNMEQYVAALDETLLLSTMEEQGAALREMKLDPGWKRAAAEYNDVILTAISGKSGSR